MAATYRFPVIIWKDHQGWYTASLVEWEERAGVGRSAKEALGQLEDLLELQYQLEPWRRLPDFLDAELVEFKIAVRPEYQLDGRRYPCQDPITLRIAGVTGRQEEGLLICSMPILNRRFYYTDPKSLRALAGHYVQQHLEGMSPRDLTRHLPPESCNLDEVIVRVDTRAKDRDVPYLPMTPTLASIAEPLGDPQVRKLYGRPWERDAEVVDLVRRLGKEKANVLLVGATGIGKTTMLADAVRQLERQEDDQGLKKNIRRFWRTSGGRIIAGMKHLGQWEERCEAMIGELFATQGVLCVDGLLDLVRQGGAGPGDSIAAFLLPYLQRNELTMVAEATPAELDACRRLLPGFADVFQILAIEPMTRVWAMNVLDRLTGQLKQNLHVDFADGVADLVFHLFHRFMPYQAFPGPASRFVAQLFETAKRGKKSAVAPGDVLALFIRQTGLPEVFLRDDWPLTYDEVESDFRGRILGQSAAVAEAANLVLTFKAGLNDPHRPIGVLLFCGPTGVGKTELARTLGDFFFGHGDKADRLIRLDMSEYTGPGAADRLIVNGRGEPSLFVQTIRQKPFSVVLLDEIEKADPEVFDVLMGVFDEGRLTDRYGRTATFRSAIVIMTSNLGGDKQASFGFGAATGISYEAEAQRYFRPEFFNRIDAIVSFEPLGAETILGITRKELAEIGRREGLAKAKLRLTWTDDVAAHLASVGFDRRYGARPLQRTIERLVVTPLSRYLLDHPTMGDAEIALRLTEAKEIVVGR